MPGCRLRPAVAVVVTVVTFSDRPVPALARASARKRADIGNGTNDRTSTQRGDCARRPALSAEEREVIGANRRARRAALPSQARVPGADRGPVPGHRAQVCAGSRRALGQTVEVHALRQDRHFPVPAHRGVLDVAPGLQAAPAGRGRSRAPGWAGTDFAASQAPPRRPYAPALSGACARSAGRAIMMQNHSQRIAAKKGRGKGTCHRGEVAEGFGATGRGRGHTPGDCGRNPRRRGLRHGARLTSRHRTIERTGLRRRCRSRSRCSLGLAPACPVDGGACCGTGHRPGDLRGASTRKIITAAGRVHEAIVERRVQPPLGGGCGAPIRAQAAVSSVSSVSSTRRSRRSP